MAKKTKKPTKTAAKKTAKANGFSPSQFVCNLVPSVGTEKDWKFADAVNAGELGAAGAIPASVDLRATWWTINNQGNSGSCVGWATGDGVFRYHLTKAGRITNTELLSPRFIWMASKETDEFTTRPTSFIEEAGTSLKSAMDVIRKYGAVKMALLPFQISTATGAMYTGSENTFYATAAQMKISSYFNLGRDPNQWKTWLATKGPILAGLSVDSGWDNATANGGVVSAFNPATVRGGHAVTIVGYLANGNFIVRNSWGTAWGDKGFAYVTPAYIAAGFYNESYGVAL